MNESLVTNAKLDPPVSPTDRVTAAVTVVARKIIADALCALRDEQTDGCAEALLRLRLLEEIVDQVLRHLPADGDTGARP
jgi:hypothetical protein